MTAAENYKIIIADDHKLISDSIELIIRENILGEVVAKVPNGRELLTTLETANVDLIILDINMPELDGYKTLQQLNTKKTAVKVLMISQYDNIDYVRKFQAMGVDGYLPKSFDLNEFIYAIKKIKAGEQFFPLLESDNQVMGSNPFTPFDNEQFKLSEREIEIILGISQGLTSKQIAQKLFISEFTVTTHRRNIFRKLDIKNAAELTLFAKTNNLI
ncbi:response regulator transcription factor [Solitalea sp. MAHUQ-68]|uniref:Response regulator transcription factor n=1 Tax=Solitalea agri TaxID=2953739 RepID=A0A9X2F6D4_9SPHI|nr:response regulator transcription factor [Solitalea agri]MCO4293221.1 response regulator transcription factor [Solitalea agri]